MIQSENAPELGGRRGGAGIVPLAPNCNPVVTISEINFNAPDEFWQDEVLRKIPTWGGRRALYKRLQTADHPKSRAYWLAFIATLDQREKARKRKKSITGLLTVYLRGTGNCIAALNDNGKILSGNAGAEILFDQLKRGVASGESLVCVKNGKHIDLQNIFPPQSHNSRRRRLTIEQKHAILEMYGRGFTMRQIAKKLSVSRSSVSRSIKGGRA